jgi:hypothetical protein
MDCSCWMRTFRQWRPAARVSQMPDGDKNDLCGSLKGGTERVSPEISKMSCIRPKERFRTGAFQTQTKHPETLVSFRNEQSNCFSYERTVLHLRHSPAP